MKKYFLLCLATAFSLLFPTFVFSLYSASFSIHFEPEGAAMLLVCVLILPLVNLRLFYLIWCIFMILEFMNFAHFYYYNTPLDAFSLALLDDGAEILQTAISCFPECLAPVFCVLVAYGFGFFVYAKIRGKKSIIASIIFVLLLAILPYKAIFKSPSLNHFMPRNDAFSLYNSYKAIVGFTCIFLPNKLEIPATYPEYEIDYQKIDGEYNVILIMGESVNANHINILGYERKTSPRLNELAKNDGNFLAKKAISSSVLTRVSLPSFMNISYFPDNIRHILRQQTNLNKLAKETEFNTFYISAQTESEAAAFAPNYIDYLRTRMHYYKKYKEIGDLILLDEFDKIAAKLNKNRNFVILHQRSAHSPYEDNYKAFADADVFHGGVERIDTYDNTMIFNDFVISEIFKRAQKLSIPTLVLFVSDHGEAMGELDEKQIPRFGHAFLHPAVANIPLFVSAYSLKDDKASQKMLEFLQILKDTNLPTHYEVAKNLASVFGTNIKNPSEIEGVFFINGTDIGGKAGYIKIDKSNFIYY